MADYIYFGVDVSEWNGVIDWSLAKTAIDFCIVRAGYGAGHIDDKALANLQGCKDNGIPYGVYWFSYALGDADAINEATYCCNFLRTNNFNPTLGVYYDWEDDSDLYYYNQMGQDAGDQNRESFAKKFMNNVAALGFQPGLYTNKNYIESKGFYFIINSPQYKFWIAEWPPVVTPSTRPSYPAPIWQYGTESNLPGFPAGSVTDANKGDDTLPIGPLPPPTRRKFKWWLYLPKWPF